MSNHRACKVHPSMPGLETGKSAGVVWHSRAVMIEAIGCIFQNNQ